MLDPIMLKSAERILTETFTTFNPTATPGRRRFAVRKAIGILSKSPEMVYGAQFFEYPPLGDYLKSIQFKVKKRLMTVIYSVG